jgi:hypothetical protein
MLDKLDLQYVKKWLTALRSGKYPQVKNLLQTYEGYCCLGVACKILPYEKIMSQTREGCILGAFIDDQSFDVQDFFERININHSHPIAFKRDYNNVVDIRALTELNDDLDL